MASKAKTVHVVEIQGQASSLQNTLKELQKSFKGINVPTGIEKDFNKLDKALTTILRKTEKGIISREEFSEVSKELTKVRSGMNSLLTDINDLSSWSDKKKLTLIPEGTQQKIAAVNTAFAAYKATVAEVIKAETNLENATKKVAEAQEALGAAKRHEAAQKGAKTRATNELKKYEEIAEAIREQTEATKNLEKAKKDLENAKAGGKSEKTISAKESVVNEAQKKKTVIDTKVASFKKKDITDYQTALEKLAGTEERYKAAVKETKSAQEKKTQAETQASIARNALNAATKADEEVQKKQANAYTRLVSALTSINPKFKELQNATGSMSDRMAQLTTIVEGLTDGELQRLNQELAGLDGSTHSAEQSLDGLNDALTKTNEAVKESDAVASQKDAFESRIKSFLGLSGAATVLKRALKDAVSTITELDKTMTEMSVVTDLTVGDYWEQLPEYSAQASGLGVAINDAYKAATLYYQQGLKGNQVTKISAETLKLAKIAGLDAADATDKMTAALRGFNMELNEASAQKVADVYAELAAITAADVGEISNAMTKTASIAHSAGMEFETTAAFLAQIVETTRESAETAGTAMKTIIARFQELKKSPEEIGEIDGEIVDANAIEGALRSVGVSLRDSSGQFRELDEVFMELSSKWDSLDTNTQRYIATIAAGSRQQSRFIAMMSDYGRTQELVSAANTSAGASNKQFSKTMESLESKLEQLKNAWHEFTMSILQSDVVKIGVDLLTQFLQIINKITQGFSFMGDEVQKFVGGFSKIASVIGIFKLGSRIFDKIKQPLASFFADVVKQAGDAGEASGRAFATRVKQGGQAAQSEINIANSQAQTQDAAVRGQVKKIAGDGTKTKIANAGLKIMDSVGIGHFADLQTLGTERKAIKANIASDKDALSKVEGGKEGLINKQKAAQEKQKAIEDKYIFSEDGVYEKGPKGGKKRKLTKNEAKGARSNRTKANNAVTAATENLEKYEDTENRIRKNEEELVKNSEKQWSSVADGLSLASGAAMGVGMAFGMVGQAFADAGFEEEAEVLTNIGSVFTTLGGVMGIIPPILSLITTLFPGLGAAGSAAGATTTAAGVTSSAAWSVVGIIVLAVVAAIVVALAVILIVMAAIKNASPEKKLEDTQKAADAAAEAANEAASAYEDLANALDALEGKYSALEELTRGTEAWNEAVKEINSSVIDLISEYPELAKFVENKEGVLTIDVNSDEVQAVLNKAEARAVMTKNESILANVAVAEAEDDVAYKNLDSDAKFMSQALTERIAKGLNEGKIFNEEGAREEVTKYFQELIGSEDVTGYQDTIDYYAEQIVENMDALQEFGECVSETSLQEQAAFDAIAMSAQSLANTMDMSAQQIQQSQVVADGDLTEQYYDEMMKKLSGQDLAHENDSGEGKYSGTYADTLDAAIKQKYGAEAKLGNDGKVTFRGSDGEDKTVTLTTDEMKRMIATQYATERTTAAIEFSDDAISQIAETMGKQFGGSDESRKAAEQAVNALYMKNGGGALTKADLATLESDAVNLQNIWDSLSTEEKLVYGGEDGFKNMEKDFLDAISGASEAFEDTELALQVLGLTAEQASNLIGDNMSQEMARGMTKQFEKISKILTGQNNTQDSLVGDSGIMNQFKGITDQIAPELQGSLTALFAGIDVTSIESLEKFRWELIHSYGIEEEQARRLVDSISEATNATSSLILTVNQFGEMAKALEELNRLTEELTELQWEYSRALAAGQGDLNALNQLQIENLMRQVATTKGAYAGAAENLATVYAAGATASGKPGVDFREYVSMNEDGSYQVDYAKVTQDRGILDESAFQEWLGSLKEQSSNMMEAKESARQAYDALVSLEETTKDSYYQLRDVAKEAVIGKLQESIDLQQATLDANSEANAALLSKLQEQINESRQAREDEKAEQNLADLETKRAYLAMDTSGANILEMMALDEEIRQAEMDMQDRKIDQAIQNLEDANAAAEQQRERQIALAQEQLDIYQQSAEFQAHIDNLLLEMISSDSPMNTTLGNLLYETQTGGMSEQEKADWQTELVNWAKDGKTWLTTDWSTQQTAAYNDISTIDDNIKVLSNSASKKTDHQQKTLLNQGFTGVEDYKTFSSSGSKAGAMGGGQGATTGAYEDYLNIFTDWAGQAGNVNTEEANNRYTEMSGDKEYTPANKIMTQSEYNESVQDKLLAGEKVKTYSEYVSDEYKTYQNRFKDKYMPGAEGWFPVKFDGWNGFSEGNNDGLLDIHGAGGQSYYVGFGSLVTGEKANFLKELMKKTYRPEQTGHPLDNVNDENPTGHAQGIYYGGKAYAYFDGAIREIVSEENKKNLSNNIMHDTKNSMNIELAKKIRGRSYVSTAFKTGGLADFTGPAWLDGTKSKPEIVLNQKDSANFIVLRDILGKVLDGNTGIGSNSQSGGDNHFDIDINVERIDNDYDVEQIADKIRRMICEDASYRNVNAVGLMR